MQRLSVLFLMLITLSMAACATTPITGDKVESDLQAKNAKALIVASRVNKIADRVIKRAGPVVVTGICVFQPQYCDPAKVAYGMASATHDEITRMISGLILVNDAEYGTTLATLYQQFRKNIDDVNKLIALYGGDQLDMTEFNAVVTAAQTATVQ